MIEPDFPANEKERQAAVEKYNLLDTLPEEEYDNITALMSYICDTPISLISLLDKERNFLKSHYGIPFSESPRKLSFCGHAINSNSMITIIEDARNDDRFFDNPLVTDQNAIFYAGVPLTDSNGYKLGTLCVYDVKPRTLNTEQQNALLAMAKQVMVIFEERYKNSQLVQMQETLNERNLNLKNFASHVSHDLKSPLSNIIALTQLLEIENKDKLDKNSLEYLKYLKKSSTSLKAYIDGILLFYNQDELLKLEFEKIRVDTLMDEVKNLTVIDKSILFSYSSATDYINNNKAALLQVLINLVTNALKYNHNDVREISIDISETSDNYTIKVGDNGDGIRAVDIDNIFELFTTTQNEDRDGNIGTGIGLASVHKMVKHLGGSITVISEEHVGSIFTFTLLK